WNTTTRCGAGRRPPCRSRRPRRSRSATLWSDARASGRCPTPRARNARSAPGRKHPPRRRRSAALPGAGVACQHGAVAGESAMNDIATASSKGRPEAEIVAAAKRVLPGGTFGNLPAEVVLRQGKGGRIWDEAGREYIDFLLGS